MKYIQPEVEIVKLGNDDIITQSPGGGLVDYEEGNFSGEGNHEW